MVCLKTVYDKFINAPIGYLRIQPIIGDKNCVYAVSHQQFRTSSKEDIKISVIDLRQSVIDFIENNLVDFEAWLDVNPSQSAGYLNSIKINGRMVSSECIAAAFCLLGRRIWVYQDNVHIIKYELNVNADDDLSPISLFHNNLHFVVLLI